ncbi:MAG TPA: hypothetical protein VIK91_03470 [Nannocystis sp.]
MAAPTPRHLSSFLACAFSLACGHEPAGAAGSTSSTGIGPDALTSPVAPVTTTEGPRLDLPRPDELTGGDHRPQGCGKVDFLFVIDNSGSMADEQSSLIASFPGFIAAIQQTLSAQDYHIMVVSTDKGEGGSHTIQCKFNQCTCSPGPNCCREVCDSIFDRTCNGQPCDTLVLDECDFKYGSGRVADGLGAACGIEGGRRYMLATQPNLEQTFACAANLGTDGSGDERPILAAQAALGPKQNGPGGCNEGFLRDDAILVLVLITDEDDDNQDGDGSFGDPADWYESVVAAKHGDPGAVVVLGLVGDGNLPGGQCPLVWDPDVDGAEPSPRLQAFVEMFEFGIVGSVCAPDYSPFFLDAVSVIDTTCDLFVPVG